MALLNKSICFSRFPPRPVLSPGVKVRHGFSLRDRALVFSVTLLRYARLITKRRHGAGEGRARQKEFEYCVECLHACAPGHKTPARGGSIVRRTPRAAEKTAIFGRTHFNSGQFYFSGTIFFGIKHMRVGFSQNGFIQIL